MKYTIKDFRKEFGTEDKCLNYLFKEKYPTAKGYYKVKGRKCWANATGEQLHPLSDTIFKKSSTPLTVWFEAIFLFSIAKNGVSAKELQRHFGMTYKCAWRIGSQIRKLMEQDANLLTGTVEVDETYFGKKGNNEMKFKNKSALMGMVERQGRVRAHKIGARETHILLGKIKANISKDAQIMTDEFRVYAKLKNLGYQRSAVKHKNYQWRKGEAYTNTIEGFWGQLKRSIRGTYHFVSAKHLQAYVDEFAFRYNQRLSPVPCFQTLVQRASR
ncbi:MAG: IS1595 family transposase [Parcubacteria group bacterium]